MRNRRPIKKDPGTSYSLMSHWMTQVEGTTQKRRPSDSFLLKAGGGTHFQSWGKKDPPVQRGPSGLNAVIQKMSRESLHDSAAPAAAIDANAPIHLRYSHNSGYDDFHKAFRSLSHQWPSKSYPTFGPPRLRHGRAGGSWRHVKEVQQAAGRRIVFVDGQTRVDDNSRLSDIPSGHMLQPDALDPNGPKHILDKPRHRLLDSRIQLEKPMRPKGMTTYGMWNKAALEHDNWNVMR